MLQAETYVFFTIHKNNQEEAIVTCSCPQYRSVLQCIHSLVATTHRQELSEEVPMQKGLNEYPLLVHHDFDQVHKLIYFVPVPVSGKWVQIRLKGRNFEQWNCQIDKLQVNNQYRGRCKHKELLHRYEGRFIQALFDEKERNEEGDRLNDPHIAELLLVEQRTRGVSQDGNVSFQSTLRNRGQVTHSDRSSLDVRNP